MPEKEKHWKIPILLGSALEHRGLEEVYQAIEDFISLKKSNQTFEKTRQLQAQKRFDYWVQEYILQQTKANTTTEQSYEIHRKNASELKSNPSTEAKKFVEQLLGKTVI